MKLKEFIKNLYSNIKDGVSRFFVAFVCSVLGYLVVCFEIVFETGADEVIVPLFMSFALVAVLSLFLKTAQEYILHNLKPIIQYAICTISGVAGFVLINANYQSLYMVMAYTGIVIALICFIFFILMRGENRDTAFSKLVSSLVFTIAVCGILSGGLSICIWAFQSLIFNWTDSYKIFLIINLFVWAICFVNIFLSFIPKKDVCVQNPKILRTLVLFAGLPLYILLIAILLVYLAKIVITGNMPAGEINWFASFASLFFIFFLLSVMQYTEKIAKLFVKYGGYFLVPVLIMQAIAVFERINAYGLTTPRTVSLTLIVISILFIVASIVIPKHLNKVALASGVIVLIVTLSPFNVIDMPIASQTNILKNTLEANNMLKDGMVVAGKNISAEDAEKIISAYEYLKYDAKNIPDFIPDNDKTVTEIFGISKKYENSSTYCTFTSKESVDISGYNKMINTYDDGNGFINIEYNNKQYNIDLKQVAKDLYEKYGTEKNDLDIYVVDENTGLYIKHFNFNIEDNEYLYTYFNGYVLIK